MKQTTMVRSMDNPGAMVPMSKNVKQMMQSPEPEPIKLTRKGLVPKVISRNVK